MQAITTVITTIGLVLVALLCPVLAADCNVSTFTGLASSPVTSQCMNETSISLLTQSTPPTVEQLEIFCKTPACQEFLQLLVDLNPAECTIPLGGRITLRSGLLEPTLAYCIQSGVVITTHHQAAANDTASSNSKHSSLNSTETAAPTTTTPPPTMTVLNGVSPPQPSKYVPLVASMLSVFVFFV